MSYCRPFSTFHIVTPGGVVPEFDKFGRAFIRSEQGQVYLVPFAAVPKDPVVRWVCHERHRIAVPSDETLTSLRHFAEQDSEDPESRSDILLIKGEHSACAELIAVAGNARIHGWGTGVSYDCSGRSFASAAERWLFRKWDDRKPGARSKDRTYGFMISSSIDC